ncbi:divergent polysaccharide deacetylase family protein [Hyphococcus flavus]|uniref:Divergent polysaccharide deacetylase family protein n=1 Tax=Hyphococcus flavus TaxID=1866326 RepID=A0AAF0CC91_9PROT|nr:divergent polysaccharide deacetylase family protein [Hyphococcus flavus]WDI32905.1 divergent polysaccharide deacetylase family protein [Hyphococcus flavus]
MPRRRFKLPVISRLTWAWLLAGSATVLAGAVFFNAAFSNEGAARIALPVGLPEMMARPQEERLAPPPVPASGDVRREATQLAALAEGEETEDGLTLIYPGESTLYTEEEDFSADEVIITIPGANKPAASVQAASLTPAARAIPDPDPALLHSTPLGKIPRIAPDGRAALRYYAKPFDGDRSAPRISIIVGGLGLNTKVTEQAIDDLPPEVSLSFAPYAKNLEFWTEKARRAGHEVIIELPMEGYGANAQALGAAALLSSRTPEENLQRLDWLMSRFGGYFAATNYMGAKFSADEAAIAPVLRKLKDAGVAYIDDTGAAQRAGQSVGIQMASVTRMIPAAAGDGERDKVRRELRALEQTAEENGVAIGKTYAYAATIEEIAAWARSLDEKGIARAPASAHLRASAAAR